jgi:hypothetical protein
MGIAYRHEGRLEDIPMKDGVIVTGDFHQHVQLKVNGNLVLSPGSTCMQSIDEPVEKAVFILMSDRSAISVPLKTRQVFFHELTSQQHLEDFLATTGLGMLEQQENVPDEIAKNIIHVRYNPDIPDAYARISEAINGRAHLFLRPISRELEHKTVEMGKTEEMIELGLEGNLSKLCLPTSSTYRIAKRLLASASPKEELALIEQSYLKS